MGEVFDDTRGTTARTRRHRIPVVALVLAAIVVAAFAGTTQARAAGFEKPVVTVSAPDTAKAATVVQLEATVTATSGFPGGTVSFSSVNATTHEQSEIGDEVAVTHDLGEPLGVGHAKLPWSFAPGTYQIYASYLPDPSDPTGFSGSASAVPALMAVSGDLPHNTATVLSADPAAIVPGVSETLTATVGTTDGSNLVPTGYVTFYDNGNSLGQVQLVDGVARLPDVGGFSSESHELTASYLGNFFDRTLDTDPLFNPSGSNTIAFAASETGHDTTTTTEVTLSHDTIEQGSTVDIVAHVTQTGGAIVPVGGKVFFSVDGGTSFASADVDGNGDATVLGVGGWNQTKIYKIDASYVGSSFDPSFGEAFLTVVPPAPPGTLTTILAYNGATTADYGDETTLSARLTDGSGNPLVRETVRLAMGSQACFATTGAGGVASCTIAVSQPAGSYTAAASFDGDGLYLSSAGTSVFTVTHEQSTLVLTTPATTITGDTIVLSATLREDGVTPIPGATIALSLGGVTCFAQTGADGVATCTVTAAGSGPEPVTASFDGDTRYLSANAAASILVQVHTTLSYTGPAIADYDDPVTLSARLTAGGTGVATAAVTFTVGSQVCPAVTDAEGIATCRFTPLQPADGYTVHVAFAGKDAYLSSGASASFTIAREQASLTLTAPATALRGGVVDLTGTLLEDGVAPIAGRTVVLTLGPSQCTTTTDTAGAWTCSVSAPATATGPAAVSGSFAGDDVYLPAPASASTLVYGLAPGGGMFAIGDRSATGAVTFWGAQWWKTNVLSGGPAPSSFKGFALHATPACGSTWSTGPGDSTPPPNGPLPDYMAVIAAGSASKAGPAVSGTTAGVVVVRTDGGYDPSSGHAGTGSVVTSIC
jgi:hypothetical protein